MLVGPSHTAFSDVDALPRGQDDIDQADFFDLVEHPSRLVAEAGLEAKLGEGFPQDVGQEAHEDVRLHPLGFLMPDGPDAKVAFVDAEGGFGLGQLHVCLPQFFGGPVADVGAKQVAAFAQVCPVAPGFVFAPDEYRSAVGGLLHVGLEQPGGSAVLAQQPPHALGHGDKLVLAFGASFFDLFQPFFDAFFEAGVHGFFFLAAVGTAAQDERLVAVGRRYTA